MITALGATSTITEMNREKCVRLRDDERKIIYRNKQKKLCKTVEMYFKVFIF